MTITTDVHKYSKVTSVINNLSKTLIGHDYVWCDFPPDSEIQYLNKMTSI